MKKWKQKAIVQKVISYLPFSKNLNYFFQKYVTKGVNLSNEYFYDRLNHAKTHLESYQKHSKKNHPEKSLEIGTGWYPIVPISFFLCGTDEIYSVDISMLTSKKKIKTTLLKFVESHQSGKLKEFLPEIMSQRLEELLTLLNHYDKHSLIEILKKLRINYLIEDARKLSLSSNSIDLINSNNTFEHIYPDLLIPILKEFKRVVKKENGVMSHFIDMTDHFAHLDSTINIYNFLRFTNEEWKWIDNTIQPQNRLRIYDYKRIYSDLEILISEETCSVGNLEELQLIPLATKYQGQPLVEVAKSHCYFSSAMSNLN